MSPRTRRRPSGRAGRVATKRGRPRTSSALVEAHSLWQDTARLVQGHTTKYRCPHCTGLPLVKKKDWPAHVAHHRAVGRQPGSRRPGMVQPPTPNVGGGFDPTWMTDSPSQPSPAERPRNPQANPGRIFKPTRPGSPHSGQRPSTVRIVDDDGQPIPTPPDAPAPKPAPPDDPAKAWPLGSGVQTSVVGGLLGAAWEWFSSPFKAKPRPRPARGDGWKWKQRPTNPGGTPVGGGPTPAPDPGPAAPVVPIRPGTPTGGPVATGSGTGGGGTGGGTGTKPKPRGGRGGGRGAGGGSGAQGIAEGARAWAQSPPDTLAGARQDAQAITEGLAGLADALLMRMNAETERSIAHECVEPYNAAAQQVRAAAEHCQEVFAKLTQRYGHLAEELAKPDTPHPEYLMEGKG